MGRPKKMGAGGRRIDAAIDALSAYGFTNTAIRNAVNELLRQVYGKDGWPFLEENSYAVVLDKLLEEADEQTNSKEGEEHEEGEAAAAADNTLLQENTMQMVQVPPTNVSPIKAEPQAGRVEPPAMAIDPPVVQAVMPPNLPFAQCTCTVVRTRHPCYGWISESESESDGEKPVHQERGPNIESPGDLSCKRKRPSRWDVRPSTAAPLPLTSLPLGLSISSPPELPLAAAPPPLAARSAGSPAISGDMSTILPRYRRIRTFPSSVLPREVASDRPLLDPCEVLHPRRRHDLHHEIAP